MGELKESMSAALRIVDAVRTGGETQTELWVRNSSAATVTSFWAHHADFGLAVMTAGGSHTSRRRTPHAAWPSLT